MKKGIEAWPDYDQTSRWCLRVKKKKGRFTLDELADVAKEFEEDFYAVIIKAVSEDMDQYFDGVDYNGDYVTMYRATDFLRGDANV